MSEVKLLQLHTGVFTLSLDDLDGLIHGYVVEGLGSAGLRPEDPQRLDLVGLAEAYSLA